MVPYILPSGEKLVGSYTADDLVVIVENNLD